MGNFTAKLELPRFIPKEQILRKYVLDSEVVCIGLVEDWTYFSDGEIKMVVKPKNGAKKASNILVPFSHVDRVGQFILLKTKRENIIENIKQQVESKDKNKRKKQGHKNKLKQFDEIDEKILNQFLKKKQGSSVAFMGVR